MPAIVVDKDLAGGEIVATLQQWLNIEDRKVVVLGDKVKPHGSHDSAFIRMIEGSPWLSIGGRPVCRSGDLASCGHVADGSQNWFNIA